MFVKTIRSGNKNPGSYPGCWRYRWTASRQSWKGGRRWSPACLAQLTPRGTRQPRYLRPNSEPPSASACAFTLYSLTSGATPCVSIPRVKMALITPAGFASCPPPSLAISIYHGITADTKPNAFTGISFLYCHNDNLAGWIHRSGQTV